MKNVLSILLLQAVLIVFTQSAFAAAATNVKCDKCVDTSDIAKKAVTSARIKSGAVTTSKIKDGSVTAAKIAGGSGSGVDADTVDGLDASQLGSSELVTVSRFNYSSFNVSGYYFSELVYASCGAGEVLTGGGCDCYGNQTFDPATTNWGYVDTCIPEGNSMVGSCTTSSGDLDTAKYGAAITVAIICAPSTLQSDSQAQALAIQSESNLPSNNESGVPDLAAQAMIDNMKSSRAYYIEQKSLLNVQ